MIKNSKKTLIIIMVIFILIFSSILSGASISQNIENKSETNFNQQETVANWTLMHYFCFDNHHMSYEIDMKMENLSKIGSTDDFNLIVAKDTIEYGDSKVYFIEENNPVDISPLFDWPQEVDMGNPNTIKAFINRVKENYPANHYGIIFYTDFGSGWQGLCRDTDGGNDNGLPLMTLPELASAFKEVTNDGQDKFDVVGIMTCISGSFESAYELAPYVNYIVFSQEHMLEPLDKGPEYIFRYFETTYNLKNNSDMSPEEFVTSMVNYYVPCDFPLWVFYTYEIIYKKGEVSRLLKIFSNILTKVFNSIKNPDYNIVEFQTTLSAINLSRLDSIKDAINNLASALILNIENNAIKDAIKNALSNVKTYGHFYPKNRKNSMLYMAILIEKMAFNSYVDFYNLIELINDSIEDIQISNLCNEVLNEIKNSVVKKTSLPDTVANGYNIYFPESADYYNKYIWNDEFNPGYENLKFSKDTLWDDFLKSYLNI